MRVFLGWASASVATSGRTSSCGSQSAQLLLASPPTPLLCPADPPVPGGAVVMHATANPERVEAPVTVRAYFICVFASFGGIFFGYDTGWMGGVLGERVE